MPFHEINPRHNFIFIREFTWWYLPIIEIGTNWAYKIRVACERIKCYSQSQSRLTSLEQEPSKFCWILIPDFSAWRPYMGQHAILERFTLCRKVIGVLHALSKCLKLYKFNCLNTFDPQSKKNHSHHGIHSKLSKLEKWAIYHTNLK